MSDESGSREQPAPSAPPSLGGREKVGGEGDVEVFVADEQGEVTIDVDRWRSLALDVLRDLGVRGQVETSILFVPVEEIAALNEEHMGAAGPTDVLAFPIDIEEADVAPGPSGGSRGPTRDGPDPSDLPLLLGDVVVCPSVALAQAPSHAGTLDDELALLIVHGLLHILGHNHEEPEETAIMRAEERRLLEAHHFRGPAPETFRQEHAA